MNLAIGKSIKRLRIEKGVTQEALAEFLNVSFQAVSKWETETTAPDIALLPKLALFFGVSIDALFSVAPMDVFERVDSLLHHEKMTEEGFAYARKALTALLAEAEGDASVLSRLGELYLRRSQADGHMAARYLEKAIAAAPENELWFGTLRQARGCHDEILQSGAREFLAFAEGFAEMGKRPRLLMDLIPVCLLLQRPEKAEGFLAQLEKVDESGMVSVLRGDLQMAAGDRAGALALWEALPVPTAKALYEAGFRLGKVGEEEAAIASYERAFEAAEAPRDLSSAYSLAFLHDRRGEYGKALSAWRRIQAVLESDWQIVKGEQAEWPAREIKRLEGCFRPKDKAFCCGA